MRTASTESTRTVYIYGLWDCNYNLRYIGKSLNSKIRYKEHIKRAKEKYSNSHKANWIRQLLSQGLEPQLEILEECNEDNWQEKEKAWIKEAKEKGIKLTNMTYGGDGIPKPTKEISKKISIALTGRKQPKEVIEKRRQSIIKIRAIKGSPMKGRHHSEETKKKLSEANKGRIVSEEERKAMSERNPWKGREGWMKGVEFTDEHKKKISESHMGENNPMWGKHHSEETKIKLSKSNKGQKRSKEFCDHISNVQKGKIFSEEHKANLRKAWVKRKERENNK